MDAVDTLVKKIFSWVKLLEECADTLDKLANEMEERQKNVNATKVLGSSVSVAGATAMAAAGVATIFTAGAALPVIAAVGGAATWFGLATNTMSDAVNIIASKNTLKEAEGVSEKIQNSHSEMKKLIKLLKNEAQKRQEQDDSCSDVIEYILRGMARRKGLDVDDSVSLSKTISSQSRDGIPVEDYLHHTLKSIGFNFIGKQAMKAAGEAAMKVAGKAAGKAAGNAAGKAAGKALGRMAGGALVLAFEVPELISNCKNLDVCETEASKNLKERSKDIRAESKKMKEELEEIEKILEEMVQHQQRDKQRQNQQDHKRKKTFLFEITFLGFHSTDRSQDTCAESESDQSQKEKEENPSPQDRRGEEEQESNQTAQTRGDQQGGSDEEDKESRDDEDEDSDQESDSKETEDDESSDEAKRPIAYANCRSINNKIPIFRRIIPRNNIKIFLLTETWLKRNTANQVLREIVPEGFKYVHWSRPNRGGGVAIVWSPEVISSAIKLTSTTTFEHVAMVLQFIEWSQSVLFINVYHRTDRTLMEFDKFLNEFENLLLDVLEIYTTIILTGDFNIHVDDDSKTATRWFKDLLEKFGLVQHVNEPTHRAGHTLDLVITRNFNIPNLAVRDENISDHYTIYFTGKPKDSEEETKDDEEEDEHIKRLNRREE